MPWARICTRLSPGSTVEAETRRDTIRGRATAGFGRSKTISLCAMAVLVLGRERIPLEDVECPLPLHDSAYDIGQGERVRRIGARREIPAHAHFRAVAHLDEARAAADGHVTSVHGGADDLDVVGAPARQLAKDVGEGPAFEAEDDGLDDFHRAAVEHADAHVEAVRDIRLGRRSGSGNQEERREKHQGARARLA